MDATTGNKSFFLPAVTGTRGKTYTLRKTDSSANTVTIDPDAAETVNGGATYVLYNQYESVNIISDGTAWLVT